MGIVQIHELSGMTQEMYEEAMRALNLVGPPPGSHLHASGPMEGGWRIVEVWDSEEAANAFYNSAEFRQVMQQVGLPRPAITSYPVASIKKQASEGGGTG